MTDNGADQPRGRSILERAEAAGSDSRRGRSLLERAGFGLDSPPVDAPPLAPAAPAAMAEAPRPAAPQPPAAGRISRQGMIDLDRLRTMGYVLPDAPISATAEEFRLVKRQILAKAARRGPAAVKNGNLILVCSSMPGEGKTFCVINLALSIASEKDLTVLLVDADFPKPEIVKRLGLDSTGPGLLDVIENPSIDLGECLIRTQIPNLTVLPAGRRSNQTTELLASERMEAITAEIAERYSDRIVLFDSPPALASSSSSVLAGLVGQVVFVVQAETTKEGALREGLALMSSCPSVQLLLNRSRFHSGVRRFGDYYAYGY
ncbi:MAG: XrtA-associated tyrosine autokinase [Sphingomonadaceae bacterium]|nr:XrtA-associated tyrosine autokinase [Sphingomonadaceae bacterium]